MKIDIELREIKGFEDIAFSVGDFIINVDKGRGEIRQQINGKTIFRMFNGKEYSLDLTKLFIKIQEKIEVQK